MDWSTGEILAALKKQGLEKDTIIMFMSDNGPWLIYGNHAGSAYPLREGKTTTWDGGTRVPFIAWWPGHVKAGSVNREMASSLDLLSTCLTLGKAPILTDSEALEDVPDLGAFNLILLGGPATNAVTATLAATLPGSGWSPVRNGIESVTLENGSRMAHRNGSSA